LNVYFFDNCSDSQVSDFSQDRGYLFGDGFFTTGLINKGQLRHEEYHYQRLQEAAQRLCFARFQISLLKPELITRISHVEQAVVRITVTRQKNQRGYGFKPDDAINLVIQLSPLPAQVRSTCHLVFSSIPISCNPVLAGIKHLNRLDSVLASQDLTGDNQEALLCQHDNVICGSRSNLFIAYQNQWLTPDLSQAGVKGITRRRLMDLMTQENIAVKETQITQAMLLSCDAAFLTNSLWGIWPVSKIDNKIVATELSENLKLKLKFEA